MKQKMRVLVAACTAMWLFGCAQHGYVDSSTVNFDRPDNATLFDMKTVEGSLVERMMTDEVFLKHYNSLLEKKGEVPVLQIGNIDNDSTARIQQKLESMRSRLESELGRTGMFEIVDDADSRRSISEEMAESIIVNHNTGLKNKAALQHFGEQATADYQLYGRFSEFEDGGRYSYELMLQLVELSTGKKVWIGIANIDKK